MRAALCEDVEGLEFLLSLLARYVTIYEASTHREEGLEEAIVKVLLSSTPSASNHM